MSLTGREVQLYAFGTNTVQQCFNVFGIQVFCIDLETKGVYTFIQNVECFCICFFRAFHLDILTHQPGVVILFYTSHIRELSGQPFCCF